MLCEKCLIKIINNKLDKSRHRKKCVLKDFEVSEELVNLRINTNLQLSVGKSLAEVAISNCDELLLMFPQTYNPFSYSRARLLIAISNIQKNLLNPVDYKFEKKSLKQFIYNNFKRRK